MFPAPASSELWACVCHFEGSTEPPVLSQTTSGLFLVLPQEARPVPELEFFRRAEPGKSTRLDVRTVELPGQTLALPWASCVTSMEQVPCLTSLGFSKVGLRIPHVEQECLGAPGWLSQ